MTQPKPCAHLALVHKNLARRKQILKFLALLLAQTNWYLARNLDVACATPLETPTNHQNGGSEVILL